jgi:hypothetical protein
VTQGAAARAAIHLGAVLGDVLFAVSDVDDLPDLVLDHGQWFQAPSAARAHLESSATFALER